MSGRVVLVGAGPGDPGLLTLRGARALAEADVVVHDELVHRRLLEHVRPEATIIGVGHSRGRRLTQDEIEALLIEHARAGRVVVRLKIGDPFVFGRGAEECQTLRRAAVPFEVVPGVTSAVAVPAWAGIPVTHREHTSLVTIATGHQACRPDDAAPGPPPLPWEALARQGGTLVFLMAVRHMDAVLERLVAHGLAPDTPAAVIERGTLGTQRTVIATAATLAGRARAAAIRPPAVLVVGSVVDVRERIGWIESRPLTGRRIVITRPREQASELARLLEEQGAEVVVFPTIAIAPPADPGALERAVAAASTYDWIIFTSANGVRVFFERFATQGQDVRALARARLAVIGPETAAALERLLLRPAVVPPEYRAEGLLEALAATPLDGVRVLLPRAAGARAVLPRELAARGAVVDEVIAYRAVAPPDADVAGLTALLRASAVDAVAFTSSSTVRHFVELLGADTVAAVVRDGRPAIACIGPVTAETAAELGLPADVIAPEYTAPALAAALAIHFCKPADERVSPKLA